MVFGLIPYETNLLKYLMIFKISPQMNVIFVDFLQKKLRKKDSGKLLIDYNGEQNLLGFTGEQNLLVLLVCHTLQILLYSENKDS